MTAIRKRNWVYICSPYRGNIRRNEQKARLYCRLAFDKGFVPIAPHLFYPQFLDEDSKSEREIGLQLALEALSEAKELWVFGLDITKGMAGEIKRAKELKIPVRYFYADGQEI